MFQSLTTSLNAIFSKIKGNSIISENQFNLAIREIRVALIEADVALEVIKIFISNIKDKVIGEQIIKQVSPVQAIIKIVYDNLVMTLGSEKSNLKIHEKKLTIIMLVGIQGSGKTTISGKLALKLKQQKKKVMLISLDIYRPAAHTQLELIGKQIDVHTLSHIINETPCEIARRAIELAKKEKYDIIILDTAGRLHIDHEMMQELKDIKDITRPTEILLIADAMIGQDAINIAKSFNKILDLTGIILTRIDGDSRGGVALSMKMMTKCPIKFISCGEKLSSLEDFYPERIANRILDMGDIVSLVEKATEIVGQEEIDKIQKRVQKGKFDFNDLMRILTTVNKMDGINNIIKFMPGSLTKRINPKGALDNITVKKYISIIRSMTREEKFNPNILNTKRRMRIVQGSGTKMSDINLLLKQYTQMRSMIYKLSKVDQKKLQESDFMNMLN
ncbi:signal recognition particle protein [Wolbachia endosymbiont of Howardula sp.]|uniref:signal recognition particle protein n=1 Tax=Wolbachia endosymbiont of Howardula sp. TaxID=2916816 RepID=UPI00217EFAFF|nr:signal recognition particle protein [Wolbachia endosymbiont of Howardula sp.]UWI83252.1 signal recognition particle protein [Wolbachia endosymbiont of Howardula sp.]